MRSYSVAVLLIAVLFTIVFFKKDDLIEARGGGYSSYSDRRRTGVYDSRRRTDYYDSRRRTDYYDSRRRTDYSRRRSSWDSSSTDYSRRRSYSGSDYESTDGSGGGGISTWANVGFAIGGVALFVFVLACLCIDCDDDTDTGPAEIAQTRSTPALQRDPTRSVGYASHPHRSPAFFSMAIGTSGTPTQANEAPGSTGTVYTTPASDDVGPSTTIGSAESASTGHSPALQRDPTRSVGYASHPHRSPAFFSMATGPSGTPSKAPPPLPSQHPSTQYPPAAYDPPAPAHPYSSIQDPPSGPSNEPPGMQAPPLPLPPQISEGPDNDNGGMPMEGYPPAVDDPSTHVSALTDAPPPSYYDLFKI